MASEKNLLDHIEFFIIKIIIILLALIAGVKLFLAELKSLFF